MTTAVHRCAEKDQDIPPSSIFKSLAPKTNVVQLQFFWIETPGNKRGSWLLARDWCWICLFTGFPPLSIVCKWDFYLEKASPLWDRWQLFKPREERKHSFFLGLYFSFSAASEASLHRPRIPWVGAFTLWLISHHIRAYCFVAPLLPIEHYELDPEN